MAKLDGGHAEMVFNVLPEKRSVGKTETVADLLDIEVCLLEIVSYFFQQLFPYPLASGFARVFFADCGQVFRRDA